MRTSLDPARIAGPLQALAAAERQFATRHPGDPQGRRQPVHTVYGGAHLFRPDTAAKLGALALAHLDRYAPDPFTFARALGLRGAGSLPSGADADAVLARLDADGDAMRPAAPDPWLAHTVYRRVVAKLRAEPVEDYRIDFEDGYGPRPDEEEDGHALQVADALADAMAHRTVPAGIGIRVKPMGGASTGRALRTLDLVVTRLVERAGGVPDGFVVTLPKAQLPEQVAALVAALGALEAAAGLAPHTLRMELMIESTHALLGADGRSPLPALLAAADGRCVAAHFGAYDFTASANVTAPDQALDHPLCDLARHHMTLAFASTGVTLSDGATTALPVGPHRGATLTADQARENRAAVHAAWRTMYGDVRRSLRSGWFQGWDLHPGQLPVRYAAMTAFFLEGLDDATARLANFVGRAAQATRVGGTFDDAATGQGLLNWFQRALQCGAIGPDELRATGLTREQIAARSFGV